MYIQKLLTFKENHILGYYRIKYFKIKKNYLNIKENIQRKDEKISSYKLFIHFVFLFNNLCNKEVDDQALLQQSHNLLYCHVNLGSLKISDWHLLSRVNLLQTY